MDEVVGNAANGAWISRLGVLFDLGGPVVMLLMAMSIIGVTIVLLKLWQFASLRLSDTRFVDPALELEAAGRVRQAREMLAANRSPVAHVMDVAIAGKHAPGYSNDLAREETTRIASRHLENLRSHLRGLEVIGALSPLLGLLGTVLGMIEAFRQLEAAGSRVDPALLSGGIWEALLTTAVGLSVAIPAVAMLTWLERRIERFKHVMEDAVTQVFTRTPSADVTPASFAETPPDKNSQALGGQRTADAR